MKTDRYKFTQEQQDFIKSFTAIADNWHYIPYWFKDCGDGTFEMHRLGELPAELKKELLWMREGIKADDPVRHHFPIYDMEGKEL